MMKRAITLLLACLPSFCSSLLQAQNAVSMETCEYWFDYDFEHRQTVAMNGSSLFQQQFDFGELPRGVHSIGLRFADSKGLWNAPIVKHFVIPSLPKETFDDNHITAME